MKQMKIVILVLVSLLLMIPTCFAEAPKEESNAPAFSIRNGITFGMSKDAVIAAEGVEPNGVTDEYFVYNDQQAAGKPAYVVYYFIDNKLSEIMFVFTTEHTNENLYINDFEKIDTSLTAKYGEATVANHYTWSRTLFKDDPSHYGLAISSGDLQIASYWLYDNYSITHLLIGDNYTINHGLYYVDKSHDKEVNTSGI